MKKIISFCLWGNGPQYTVGAVRNAELAKAIYSDWTARFYVGTSTSPAVVRQLQQADAEVVLMNAPGDWRGTLWRFYPAGEPDIEAMLSRDTDSRLSLREKAAVDEWLASGKQFHIMRDHPAHKTEILGGMWGARGGVLTHMKLMIDSYAKGNFWQMDQNFLREKIYPLIRDDVTVHDEFFEGNPFPTARQHYEFVGDVFDEGENRHPEYWKSLVR
jgi:hypothetical protein